MNEKPTDKIKKSLSLISLAIWTALLLGCAADRTAEVSPPESKRITDIVISETSELLFLTIKGNRPLTYTVDNQVDPIGILFQFPDTALDIEKGFYSPPNYEIIRSIKADQIGAEMSTTSRILVVLNRETPYDLQPDNDGIKVSFHKTAPPAKSLKPQRPRATIRPKPQPTKKKMTVATRLTAVTATPLTDRIIVRVGADGAITAYKPFTMENPARIVLDLFKLKSPHKEEQKIAVESKWLTRIRHFGHPDKVRLVLETHHEFLSKFSIHTTDNGLLINIGNIAAASDAADQSGKDVEPESAQVELE